MHVAGNAIAGATGLQTHSVSPTRKRRSEWVEEDETLRWLSTMLCDYCNEADCTSCWTSGERDGVGGGRECRGIPSPKKRKRKGMMVVEASGCLWAS